MKKLLVILLCFAAVSCGTKVEPELFSVVTINLSTEDGARVVSMVVSSSMEGNQFRNLNTGINYAYPRFQDNYLI